MPERVRLSRARGFRLPANAVNVARPSRWGNPFIVGKHGTRLQCAALFHQLCHGFISFTDSIEPDDQLTFYRWLRRHIGTLAGKDLACWCALDGGACHADVLMLFANPEMARPQWMRGEVDIGRVRLGMAAWDIEAGRRRMRQEREVLHG